MSKKKKSEVLRLQVIKLPGQVQNPPCTYDNFAIYFATCQVLKLILFDLHPIPLKMLGKGTSKIQLLELSNERVREISINYEF